MQNKNYQKRPLFPRVRKSQNSPWVKIKKIANKFIFLCLAFCSIYFVVCVNDIAIKGFVIKDLKVKIAELNEENKKVELKVHDLQSLESIKARALEMKMVKVDKIDYITVVNGAVALND